MGGTTYIFYYNDEVVKWTFKKINTTNWAPENRDLTAIITCPHPEFLLINNSPSVAATSLSYLIEKGKKMNREFFSEMEKSFFTGH